MSIPPPLSTDRDYDIEAAYRLWSDTDGAMVRALCRLLSESRAEVARWRAAVQFIRDQYPEDVFVGPAGIMARKVCENIVLEAERPA